jgi:hypothetical protein
MVNRHLKAALRGLRCEVLADDGFYECHLPELPNIWSTA